MAFFRSKSLPTLSIKANPKNAVLLITGLVGSFPPWASPKRKHRTVLPPSSGMTIFYLKRHSLMMKKIKKQKPVRSETSETSISQIRHVILYQRYSSYRKTTVSIIKITTLRSERSEIPARLVRWSVRRSRALCFGYRDFGCKKMGEVKTSPIFALDQNFKKISGLFTWVYSSNPEPFARWLWLCLLFPSWRK